MRIRIGTMSIFAAILVLSVYGLIRLDGKAEQLQKDLNGQKLAISGYLPATERRTSDVGMNLTLDVVDTEFVNSSTLIIYGILIVDIEHGCTQVSVADMGEGFVSPVWNCNEGWDAIVRITDLKLEGYDTSPLKVIIKPRAIKQGNVISNPNN